MKTFDPTKPVQTRDGRKVRILCTDAEASRPIIGLVRQRNGTDMPLAFNLDGTFVKGRTVTDLVNIPERKVETRAIIANPFATEKYGEYGTRKVGIVPAHQELGYLDFISVDGELVDVVFRNKKENK